jgi:transcriptional regulator with XRE-family HTH domain
VPDQILAGLGERLRHARSARGWSLDELAARTSISPSTLSRLETGKRQATLELLLPITRQLGIRIDDLVSTDPPDPRVRRPAIRRDGLIIEPLTPEGSPIHTYRITYPPTMDLPQLRSHDGFEWLYVLSGKLRLRVGERDLTLVGGEAAEFDTQIPHALSAVGGRPARILSIFNEAGVRLHTHTATPQ